MSLIHATIRTQLRLSNLRVEGDINLAELSTADLRDDPSAWSFADHVELDGLTYRALSTDGWSVDDRLAWLGVGRPHVSGRPFRPRPFDELAAWYRSQGASANARTVLIRREDERLRSDRDEPTRSRFSRAGRRVLQVTVAHGYRPARAVWLLIVIVLTSTLLFRYGPHHSTAIVPSDGTGRRAGFNPLVFSLDQILPIVDFREADRWTVDPTTSWSWLYRSAIWMGIALGWLLSTLLVAAVTRLTRSDSD